MGGKTPILILSGNQSSQRLGTIRHERERVGVVLGLAGKLLKRGADESDWRVLGDWPRDSRRELARFGG
jgi:hypothetical protein